MWASILADMPLRSGDRVAVMVNGLGATPPEELYILYRKVHALLADRDVQIHRAYVGEYATSMEMAGASLTLFRLDEGLSALLDAPAQTPFFVQTEGVGTMAGMIDGTDVLAAIERVAARMLALRDPLNQLDAAIALRSKIGRASWVGERTEGQPDPGTVLIVQILETIARAPYTKPGSAEGG